jgi:hypothetical protein
MNLVPNQDKRIELKYLLDEQLAQDVKVWARERLGRDPHCCESLVDSYDVHTLYLDTSTWDLYHRTGVVGSTKYRIRQYSHEETLWLECKRKKKDVVRKNRTAVPATEAADRLSGQLSSDHANWCGDWFVQRIADRSLRPAVQVHYRRFARTSTLEGESLRLTIDSHLQASRVSGWDDSLVRNQSSGERRQNVSPVQILELKFHNQMPWLFKELLRKFAIPASGFSKYRSAVDGCQLLETAEQLTGDRLTGDRPSPTLSQSPVEQELGLVANIGGETARAYGLEGRLSDV